MKYNVINVNEAKNRWNEPLKELTGVSDDARLSWMSVLCENKVRIQPDSVGSLFESYLGFSPNAITGMGNVSFPAPGSGNYHDATQAKGSGDQPARLLGLAMHVAAETVGFDLVPVIPMEFPSGMFSFFESVYGGGKIEAGYENPDYIRVFGGTIGTSAFSYANLTVGGYVYIAEANSAGNALVDGHAIRCRYIQKGRIGGEVILKVENVGTMVASTGVFTPGNGTLNVIDYLTNTADTSAILPGSSATQATLAQVKYLGALAKIDLVATYNELIKQASNSDGLSGTPMDRKTAELGTQRSINLRLWSTSVAAKDYDILATVTNKQVRDLRAYGIDAVEELMKAAKNEVSQSINRHILTTLFQLGVTSHAELRAAQSLDLNLLVAPTTTASKNMSAFGFTGPFEDITGTSRKGDFTAIKNNVANSAAENFATRQRMISSRLLASAGMIGNVGRFGQGDFCVVNVQIANALRDNAQFQASPMANTVAQAASSLYYLGTVAGINVYVDPLMDWADTRILVGRKGTDNDPGLKFLPYDLASSVQTIEGDSMSPKILISSSYALVPAGFYPHAQYLTFALENEFGSWV